MQEGETEKYVKYEAENINLPASLKHYCCFVVRQILRFDLQALRSSRLALGKLKIVIHQQIDHDGLDVSRCKETARTSVPAIAESHARRVRRGIGHER